MSVGRGKRDARDVQEIARREPAHLLGEVVDRVEQETFVVADGGDAPLGELDRAGDACGARADDRDGRLGGRHRAIVFGCGRA